MSGEPAGGTNLLSFDVIKSELRTIRGKGGISHDTVYEYGWALLRLPCVTHEMDRSRLAELGRPEAAIRAITCAVYKALPNPQHQLFLQHTLLRADPAKTITQRLYHVAALLGRPDASLNTLKSQDLKAYRELASVLVRLSVSPCAQDDADAIAAAIAVIQNDLEDLARVLGAAGFSFPAPTREAASRELLARYPVGESLPHPSVPLFARARILVIAAIRELEWLTTDVHSPSIEGYLSTEFLWAPGRDYSITKTVARSLDIAVPEADSLAARTGFELSSDFAEVRHQALTKVIEIMEEQEALGWPSLRGGEPVRARELVPTS